jgi:tellurite resistance protein
VDSLGIEQLVGSVIRGALGGRSKRHRGALRYLTGGGSSWLNATTLMAVAGVAWGLWETSQRSSSAASAPAAGAPAAPGGPAVVPPPLPSATLSVPPLPTVAASPAPLAVTPPPLPPAVGAGPPPDVLRVLRLTLSAARADGVLTHVERDAILAQARLVGAEALVAPELDAPRPLAEVVGVVTDPRLREDLYTLAFAIVRADEQVQPGERAYLTELAALLELDAAALSRIEEHAAARIASSSEGDQS